VKLPEAYLKRSLEFISVMPFNPLKFSGLSSVLFERDVFTCTMKTISSGWKLFFASVSVFSPASFSSTEEMPLLLSISLRKSLHALNIEDAR
jgi:hypothetical protein